MKTSIRNAISTHSVLVTLDCGPRRSVEVLKLIRMRNGRAFEQNKITEQYLSLPEIMLN